jgi:hypothetical protein
LGIRIERVLLLSKRLREAQKHLIVEFIEEDRLDADLSRLVSFRNKWAHVRGQAVGLSSDADFGASEGAIERLLWKVAPVAIAVVSSSQQGLTEACKLHGLRGLFDAPLCHIDQPLPSVEEGVLVALAQDQEAILLSPFLVHARGRFGENRVKMLARLAGNRVEYYDPLEFFDPPAR